MRARRAAARWRERGKAANHARRSLLCPRNAAPRPPSARMMRGGPCSTSSRPSSNHSFPRLKQMDHSRMAMLSSSTS
eukprot:7378118-Prymnesium_polylepis.1